MIKTSNITDLFTIYRLRDPTNTRGRQDAIMTQKPSILLHHKTDKSTSKLAPPFRHL